MNIFNKKLIGYGKYFKQEYHLEFVFHFVYLSISIYIIRKKMELIHVFVNLILLYIILELLKKIYSIKIKYEFKKIPFIIEILYDIVIFIIYFTVSKTFNLF